MIEVDGFEPKTNFSCPNHREELGHSRLQFFTSFPAQKSDKAMHYQEMGYLLYQIKHIKLAGGQL